MQAGGGSIFLGLFSSFSRPPSVRIRAAGVRMGGGSRTHIRSLWFKFGLIRLNLMDREIGGGMQNAADVDISVRQPWKRQHLS
jgi:hypothetical protein